ncbi:hypothetical protein ACFQS1_37140 [Paractinoplanes rhizophilus]|uniref:Uncharacterized protein n=1 Tax=Paractinoplanes rhizophilus TaxID=1416877 RepID=A0ABW2I452_9ACTN
MNLTAITAWATCRKVLTEHRYRGQVEYRHPVVEAAHEVVTVDAGQVQRPFDQYLSRTEELPVWNYRTGLIQPLLALDAGALRTYNDQWQVCYRRAQHIATEDIADLPTLYTPDMWMPHHAGRHGPRHRDQHPTGRDLPDAGEVTE